LNPLLNLNNKNYNIMKKVILTLTALFFTLLSFSQGIAVQGIARDANNTARVNTLLTLQFQVYYRDGATEVSIYNRSSNVTTDFFGVFSHVIEIEDDAGTVTEFGNQELWLRISEGSTVISEAKFNRVPYAYAASNGVPTGSIMPFIGTTAPSGWLLCDGGTIEAVRHTRALRDLLGGTTTPDLRGMFLRGTGTSSLSETDAVKEGPTLMSTQQDSNKEHKHTKGTLVTAADGDHNHHTTSNGTKYSRMTRASNDTPNNRTGNVTHANTGYTAGSLDILNSVVQKNSGIHEHTILGSVASSGGIESRPVNYGVNYIIKL
jgi:microcystin-dependent protein